MVKKSPKHMVNQLQSRQANELVYFTTLWLLQLGILSLQLSQCAFSKCVPALTLSAKPQDPMFPAGLPTHLAPSFCTSDSASADHCAHLQIIFTYLFSYLLTMLYLQ